MLPFLLGSRSINFFLTRATHLRHVPGSVVYLIRSVHLTDDHCGGVVSLTQVSWSKPQGLHPISVPNRSQ